MIKKYNRIFVNRSAAASDVLAVFLPPLSGEQGPLCLTFSSPVIWPLLALCFVYYFKVHSWLQQVGCLYTLGGTSLVYRGWAVQAGPRHFREWNKEVLFPDWLPMDHSVFLLLAFLPFQVKEDPG